LPTSPATHVRGAFSLSLIPVPPDL
jgi:hypothetical protein